MDARPARVAAIHKPRGKQQRHMARPLNCPSHNARSPFHGPALVSMPSPTGGGPAGSEILRDCGLGVGLGPREPLWLGIATRV